MNMNLHKTIVSSLLLINFSSFAMIVKYKDEKNKKIFEDSAAKYCKRVAADIDDKKERKEIEALPREEQGWRNLEILYKNQHNTTFVAKILQTRYVPVLVLGRPYSKSDVVNYMIIDPYNASFYHHPGQELSDKKIVAIGFQRLSNALGELSSALDKKYESLDVKNKNTHIYGCGNHCLVNSVLFGTEQDIIREIDKNHIDVDQYREISHILESFAAAVNYPHKKNNAIQLLLSKIKEEFCSQRWQITVQEQIAYARYLLDISAQNKQAFEQVSRKDPYCINRAIFVDDTINKRHTMLEIMREDKRFDQENIDIFISDGYGMTTQELEHMQLINQILH